MYCARRMREWAENLLGGLSTVVLGALMVAMPVPGGNELVYLPLLKSRADPSYLVGDWTFSSGFGEHAVFNAVFGPVVDVIGIDWLAIGGRVVTWFAIGWLVVSLGRRLGARWWASMVALAVFLGLNQSLGVGAEFLLSGFEAKSIAWPLLLAAIIVSLDKRPVVACALVGLVFTFHPAVGIWGGGSLLLALLAIRTTRGATARGLPVAAIASLPGLVPLVADLGDSSMTGELASFIVLTRIPHHADPAFFGERGPLILGLMIGSNLLWAWINRSSFTSRLLGAFQIALLVVFALGVLARVLELWEFLLLLPFRVLPIVVNLVFWLLVAAAATGDEVTREWLPSRDEWRGRPTLSVSAASLAVVAMAAALVLWNPIARVVDAVSDVGDRYSRSASGVARSMEWVASNTERDSVVAMPPWVDEMFYITERPQLVSYDAVTYDRPAEWKSRLERTVADQSVLHDRRASVQERFQAFHQVTAPQWRETATIYGVDYLITTARLEFRAVYEDGDWRVYELAP